MTDKLTPDHVDQIVDDILQDTSKAAELRARLRQRLFPEMSETKSVTQVRVAGRQQTWSDPDDFWDNVPV